MAAAPVCILREQELLNGLRIIKVLNTVATEALQREFLSIITRSSISLQNFLNNHQHSLPKHLINKSQKSILFPNGMPPNITKFDISLLYVLFRNLHLPLFPPNGMNLSHSDWETFVLHNEPPLQGIKHGLSMNAQKAPDIIKCLIAIKKFRNKFSHSEIAVSDQDFQLYWMDLENYIKLLGVSQSTLDECKGSVPLPREVMSSYAELLLHIKSSISGSNESLMSNFTEKFGEQQEWLRDHFIDIAPKLETVIEVSSEKTIDQMKASEKKIRGDIAEQTSHIEVSSQQTIGQVKASEENIRGDIAEQTSHLEVFKQEIIDVIKASRQQTTNTRIIEDMRSHLMNKYKRDVGKIKLIPGECIEASFSADKNLIMEPEVSLYEIVHHSQVQKLQNRKPFHYSDVNISSCKEALKKSLGKRMIVVGEAGVGKTFLCQHEAYEFATEENSIFNLVILLPVRNITSTELPDILIRDLKYLKDDYRDSILLGDFNKKNTVFIVDGLDEVSRKIKGDLLELINGELFSEATVWMTTRPSSDLDQIIQHQKPTYKLDLQGFSIETSKRYMHAFLGKGDLVEKLITRLTDELSVEEILCVPFYVSLLCIIYMDNIEYNSDQFYIPKTNTELFSMFLRLYLRHHPSVKRGRYEKIAFSRIPIHDPDVPTEIQRILHSMAKMCYETLYKKKFTFTIKGDLVHYLLDVNDIRDLGMFIIDKAENHDPDSSITLFLRHRLLQEYFAGLYLATEIMEWESEIAFKFLNNSFLDKYTHQLPADLISILNHCEKAFLFACGLNPQFLELLLQWVKSESEHFAVRCKPHFNKRFFGDELSFFHESNEDNVLDTFMEFLTTIQIISDGEDLGRQCSTKHFSYFRHLLIKKPEQALGAIKTLYPDFYRCIKDQSIPVRFIVDDCLFVCLFLCIVTIDRCKQWQWLERVEKLCIDFDVDDLSHDMLRQLFDYVIQNCMSLHVLSLECCYIPLDVGIVEKVCRISSLQELTLLHCKSNGLFPQIIAQMKCLHQLKSLNIVECEISEDNLDQALDILKTYGKHFHLTKLVIDGVKLQRNIEQLTKFNYKEKLYTFVQALARLCDLKHLQVNRCIIMTLDKFNGIMDACPALLCLDVRESCVTLKLFYEIVNVLCQNKFPLSTLKIDESHFKQLKTDGADTSCLLIGDKVPSLTLMKQIVAKGIFLVNSPVKIQETTHMIEVLIKTFPTLEELHLGKMSNDIQNIIQDCISDDKVTFCECGLDLRCKGNSYDYFNLDPPFVEYGEYCGPYCEG